jgi:U2 small nuclear ribonucleoprotein B''
MDVVALKTKRLRGQAWIVFEDIGSATRAMRGLQSFPFYDRPMHIAFAKTKSRAVAIEDGSYKHKKIKTSKEKVYIGPPPTTTSTTTTTAATTTTKKTITTATNEQDGDATRILMCTDLPEACTKAMLEMLFNQFQGLVEVRFIEGKLMAFVEYENTNQSEVVMNALQNFRLSETHNLNLSYAK